MPKESIWFEKIMSLETKLRVKEFERQCAYAGVAQRYLKELAMEISPEVKSRLNSPFCASYVNGKHTGC